MDAYVGMTRVGAGDGSKPIVKGQVTLIDVTLAPATSPPPPDGGTDGNTSD